MRLQAQSFLLVLATLLTVIVPFSGASLGDHLPAFKECSKVSFAPSPPSIIGNEVLD
jgi:hypothetical protein